MLSSGQKSRPRALRSVRNPRAVLCSRLHLVHGWCEDFYTWLSPSSHLLTDVELFSTCVAFDFSGARKGREFESRLALAASLCRMDLSWSVWEKWIRRLCLAETSTMVILNLQWKDTGSSDFTLLEKASVLEAVVRPKTKHVFVCTVCFGKVERSHAQAFC